MNSQSSMSQSSFDIGRKALIWEMSPQFNRGKAVEQYWAHKRCYSAVLGHYRDIFYGTYQLNWVEV